MSRFSRVIVLVVGLMSVFAAMAGAASATSWRNTGDTAFTATTGPTDWAASSATIRCAGGTATGTAPSTAAGPNYVITGSMTFRPCTLIGNPTITCTYTLTSTSGPSGGVTRGNVAMNCADSLLGCRIVGTIPGTYTNATTTANGALTLFGTSGLTSSGCLLSGPVRLAPTGAPTAPVVFTTSNGTGGSHPTNRFGPILSQP